MKPDKSFKDLSPILILVFSLVMISADSRTWAFSYYDTTTDNATFYQTVSTVKAPSSPAESQAEGTAQEEPEYFVVTPLAKPDAPPADQTAKPPADQVNEDDVKALQEIMKQLPSDQDSKNTAATPSPAPSDPTKQKYQTYIPEDAVPGLSKSQRDSSFQQEDLIPLIRNILDNPATAPRIVFKLLRNQQDVVDGVDVWNYDWKNQDDAPVDKMDQLMNEAVQKAVNNVEYEIDGSLIIRVYGRDGTLLAVKVFYIT